MTGTTYQLYAQRTSNPDLTPGDHLLNGVMGLNGEAGEVIDLIKKHHYQGHPFDSDKLIDELGDCLWYIAECAAALGTTVDAIMEENIRKLTRRYPQGFSAERSVNRE